MPNGSKDVEHLALILRRVAHAVGGKDGQAQALRDAKRGLVAKLFGAIAMTLQLDINIAMTEDFGELFNTTEAPPLRRLPESQRRVGLHRHL